MVLVKNLNFHAGLFFIEKTPGYTVNSVLERKPAFLNYKRSFSKSRKICIFAKGLTHDFGQRFEISCRCVFLLNRLRDTVK